METKYEAVTLDDLKTVRECYKRSKFRRKLAELLHIKEKCSSSNIQEASILLKLFN